VPTPKKAQQIEEISELLRDSTLTILTDYRGLTVADMQGFRSQLREKEARLKVVKNTLTRIAARRVGLDVVTPLLEGPTAIVCTAADPVAAAKVVTDFARTSRILTIKGALLEGKLLPPAEVERLATLPPREELLAKVVGGLQAPLYGLVSVLSGPIRSLAYVLQARARQLEGGEQGSVAAEVA
jgi:large subunit ribosomal protein L10